MTMHNDINELLRHAHWIINPDGYYPYCSNCGQEPKAHVMSIYCPNCGAKMDEKGAVTDGRASGSDRRRNTMITAARKCPKCGGDSRVYGTRETQSGQIRRNRKCVNCGFKFITLETYEKSVR